MSVLAVEDLHVHAGSAHLVRGVSLVARPGVPLTVIGETGSGKTLLAESVMGTLARGLQASGRVVIGGAVSPAADARARRPLWGRALAMLPQEPWLALDPLMRAAPQVAETYRFVRGVARVQADARAAADLHTVGLAPAARRFPFQLSGGMAQRTALAATRATGAPALIADEPTKGLDAPVRDTVGAMLRAGADADGILLTITHDIALARLLGGEVAVMLDGVVVEQGGADQVLRAPTHDYTRRLLAAEPDAWPRRTEPAPGPDVLRAERLRLSRGGAVLFAGLDVTVRGGEWIAVTGPSGCGKTSLGNVLLGLLEPDAGQVRRPAGLAATRYQKLYQDPIASFAPRRILREQLGDVARRHGVAPGWTDAMLARLRLPHGLLDRIPAYVSGGELQRVALVRALMPRPAMMFADEPTSRLDPVSQQETIALMQQACAEIGCAVLLVTHDPALARACADRVMAIGS